MSFGRLEESTHLEKVAGWFGVAAMTVFWGIWREINNKIFNNSTRSPESTFHACASFISFWINLLSGKSRDLALHVKGQSISTGFSDI